MKAYAYAKVNLGLQIRHRDANGYHPLRGVFQSIDWRDDIRVDDADDDAMEVPGGEHPKTRPISHGEPFRLPGVPAEVPVPHVSF